MKKRVLSSLLIFILFVVVFASCGEDSAKSNSSQLESTPAPTAASEPTDNPAEEITLPEFPSGPLTLEEYYDSGRLRRLLEIESFDIVDAEISSSGSLHITCQIIGTLSGSGGHDLFLTLKCYDKDDILIENGIIWDYVSEGERFRITDDVFIPIDTSRIELVCGATR